MDKEFCMGGNFNLIWFYLFSLDENYRYHNDVEVYCDFLFIFLFFDNTYENVRDVRV